MQKYDRYKDSGIEWLGKIPEHWEVKPGFTVLKERKEKNRGMINKNVLSLSYGKIIEKPAEKLTGLVPENFETYQIVYKGDIIFRPTDLQNDKTSLRTGISNYKGIITSAYICLQPINSNPKFIHYFLHTTDLNKVIYGMGSGLRQNISFNDFKRFELVIPPIPEQQAVAAFLEDKCGKIDEAVRIKKQQIDKLKELRQITIHNAVIKGINPNAEMKDSGIDWIGEIPKYWEVKRLKYVFKILKRIANELGHEVLSITQKGIQVKDITSGEGQLAMDYSKYQLAYTGDFAMNHMDLLTGWVDVSKHNGVISPDYRVFELINKSNIPAYFLHLLQDCYRNKTFYAHGQGVSMLGRWRFPTENFYNFSFPIPPILEQEQIVTYLEEKTTKIDEAIARKTEQIAKLNEYKQSLINEVVTGKVKVTN